MALSNTFDIDVEKDKEPNSDEDLLEQHWDCFDAQPYFAAFGPSRKKLAALDNEDQHIPPLIVGEVYSLLDFCCHRVPAWYRSEVTRLQQLFENKDMQAVDDSPSCNSSILDTWESSYAAHLEQHSIPAETRATATYSLIVTIKTKPTMSRKPASRVQPPRTAKRKRAEAEDSKPRVTIKRRKSSKKTAASRALGTYHISKPTLSHALHLSLPPTDVLHNKPCPRSYRSFRNRLVARLTSKMVGIYSRRALEKPKPRRCVLHGRETAGAWCRTDGEAVEAFRGEGEFTAPEAEMLASPSCANWPPLVGPRSRMVKERMEENVVDFEGLKFLVDVCGEPPLPRVLML